MAAIAHDREGDTDSGGGGGGQSKMIVAYSMSDVDPIEMLQTIRQENAQLVRGEAGSATWKTLYYKMKALYNKESEASHNNPHYDKLLKKKCPWARIKFLEHSQSYKELCKCYIFRDIGRGASDRDLGYHFPADLRAPQGRNWVQGGTLEHDDKYDSRGQERDAREEIQQFQQMHELVAWSPEYRDNPHILPTYWYRRGFWDHDYNNLGIRGGYTPGDRHPTLNAPYGGHLESFASVEGRPIGPPIPLAGAAIPLEEGAGGGGGESKSEALVAHRAPDIVSARAWSDDERASHAWPDPDEMGGGRKRRKKTRRKKKRKTKRLRRKKRKTKRRRKKKRTRRKR